MQSLTCSGIPCVHRGIGTAYPQNLNKKTLIGGNIQTKSKIIKEEKEKSGMFSTKIYYTIQTTPMNFVVKRTFEHFEWLRSKFSATYPGAYVPPIESDSNRAAFLNNFLMSILGWHFSYFFRIYYVFFWLKMNEIFRFLGFFLGE